MAENIQYLIYPPVANDYSFPTQVRQAIARSPELVARYADKIETATAISNLGDTLIDGGTP